ncbi:MAG: hypothetical protein Q4D36_07475 [Bacteroidales bacterium]|nr:hypothetical protein [Bacteroidales bacterium]
MKTRWMKFFGIVALTAIAIGLSSCEIQIDTWDDADYNEFSREQTHKLCSRTWVESWTQDGKFYSQWLDFYENRTGREIMQVEYRNGRIEQNTYYFDWSWDNKSQTRIRMVYGPGDVSILEDLWMGGNTLGGWLDGVEVHFTGQ